MVERFAGGIDGKWVATDAADDGVQKAAGGGIRFYGKRYSLQRNRGAGGETHQRVNRGHGGARVGSYLQHLTTERSAGMNDDLSLQIRTVRGNAPHQAAGQLSNGGIGHAEPEYIGVE